MRCEEKRVAEVVTSESRLSAILALSVASTPAQAHAGTEVFFWLLTSVLIQLGCLVVVVWRSRIRKALTGLVYLLGMSAFSISFFFIPYSIPLPAAAIVLLPILLPILAATVVYWLVGRGATG